MNTSFPYPTLNAALIQDGNRTVYWAAQCDIGRINGKDNVKCCIVYREPPTGKITKADEVIRYPMIYGLPAWHTHWFDGTAIVYGKTESGDEWRSLVVPTFVPLPSTATITRLTVQLANALERIQKLEAR